MRTMRRLFVALAAFSGLAATAQAQTYVRSNIAANTVWTSVGNPYIVDEPVTIMPGATLTIEAGVVVQAVIFPINIEGTLLALGTQAAPITFSGISGGPWGGLRFTNSLNNVLAWVSITGALAPDETWDPIYPRRGGAVRLADSYAQFSHVTILANSAAYRGGGVYVTGFNSNAAFADCEIRGNQSTDKGGGVVVYGGAVASFTRCLIAENSAAVSDGGAIYAFDGATVNLNNCTVANNTDTPASSCIYVGLNAGLNVTNSIVWGNSRGILNVTDVPELVAVSYSDVQNNLLPGPGNISVDPLFVSPAGSDYTLQPTSPAINAGDPQSPPDPDGTRADMGAFYFPQQQQEVIQSLQLPTVAMASGDTASAVITGTLHKALSTNLAFTFDANLVESIELVSSPFQGLTQLYIPPGGNTAYIGLADPDSVTLDNGTVAVLRFTAKAGVIRQTTPLEWVPSPETQVDEQPVQILLPGSFSILDNPPVWTQEPRSFPQEGDDPILENVPLVFTIAAYDQDNDPITYSMSGLPEPGDQGPFLDPSTGALSWTPTYDQAGTYSVTFTASTTPSDPFEPQNTSQWLPPSKPAGLSQDVSIQKTVTITVTNVDRPPYWVIEPTDLNVPETTPIGFTVQAADYDLLEVPTYSITGLPSGATFEGGLFSWTPSYTQSGIYPMTFTATSGPDNLTASKQITITVTNTDQPPYWTAAPATQYGDEMVPMTFTIEAVDPDGDLPEYSSTALPSGAYINPGTGEFTWTPTYDQAGSYPVTFTATSGPDQLTVAGSITIEVMNTDRPPTWTIEPPTATNVAEAAELTITIAATDPDVGEVVTYGASGLPDGANWNPEAGIFSWVPDYDAATYSPYTVTFTATGTPGAQAKPAGQAPAGTVEKSVTITVTNTDRPPEWFDAPVDVSVNEMVPLSFQISATDQDGETPVYTSSALPTGATFASGAFSWTPTFAQSGSYPITFTATSGPDILTVSKEVTITVNNVNRAPVWTQTAAQSVDENQTLSFTVSATDDDGQALTYGVYTTPSGASFTPATRTFSWTPDFTQAGPYQVAFHVSDGEASVDMVVDITINNVNQLPVWTPVADQTVAEGDNLNFSVSVSDPDETALELAATQTPSGAQFLSGDRWFEWTPGFDDAGQHEVTLRAWDGEAEVFETFTITVTNTNRLPVFEMPSASLPTKEGEILEVTAFAYDPDEQEIVYSIIDQPSGSNFDAGTGLFTWQPTFDQEGAYVVTFRASDGEGFTDHEYSITILKTTLAPFFLPRPDTTIGAGLPLSFTISAIDPFGDTPEYGLSEFPEGAELVGNAFSWTPAYSDEGPFTVVFTATNRDTTVTDTVVIAVFSRYGDVSGDGNITGGDASIVLQWSVKIPVEINLVLADVTGNGTATAYDAALILYKVIYPEYPFPVQSPGATKPGSGLPSALAWERIGGGWALRAANPFGIMAGEFTLTLPSDAPVTVTGGDMIAFRQDGRTLFVSVVGSQFSDGTLFTLQTADAAQPGVLSVVLNEGAIEAFAPLPTAFVLEQNAPNPFNPTTTIRFALPEASQVHLVVYDVNGRAVRTLVSRSYQAGVHSIVWDARDDNGRDVASGTYIYRVATNKGSFVKRMTLLK